jgi:thioredoxin reductase (NADPH)
MHLADCSPATVAERASQRRHGPPLMYADQHIVAEQCDVIIIGAGPVGLACAIEAKRERLTPLVIEKGALVNSIVGYPHRMEFFSTPDLIEIGGYPFPIQGYKPTREEALEYYRGVAQREALDLRLYERVVKVTGQRLDFTVQSDKTTYRTRHVVVATGFFDIPNPLGVPGAELGKVTHYYREPFPYVRQRIAVVGAKNSAAKAALDCYRHGADVTLVVRGASISSKVKYWLKPDLENRIAEGSIRAFFNTSIAEIKPQVLVLNTPDGPREIANDWVLAMTGYRPDYSLLESLQLSIADDSARTPRFDETTFESSRPGVYLAGTVCGGLNTGRWFIENGRHHARQIAQHISGATVTSVPFGAMHWKTEE